METKMTREEAVALLERYSNYDGMGIPNLAGCKEAMKVAVDALKEVLPELAESEDERIRKGLVKLLTVASEAYVVNSTGIKKDSYLTYLEKQQESLHIPETSKENANSFTDEDERIRRWLCDYFSSIDNAWIHKDITCIDILKWLEKQKEQNLIMANSPQLKEQKPAEKHDLVTQLKEHFANTPKEQLEAEWKELEHWNNIGPTVEEYFHRIKPAEWSEEDKEMLGKVLECIRFAEDRYQLEQEGTNGVSVKLWLLDHIIPQQKPEWSEEDEKDMAHIIRILDDCYVYGTHDLSKTDHENLVNKLKSLRPSWKPSEEQMKALLNAEGFLRAGLQYDSAKTIAELYEQLKKL